jgi:hypothetical protein
MGEYVDIGGANTWYDEKATQAQELWAEVTSSRAEVNATGRGR